MKRKRKKKKRLKKRKNKSWKKKTNMPKKARARHTPIDSRTDRHTDTQTPIRRASTVDDNKSTKGCIVRSSGRMTPLCYTDPPSRSSGRIVDTAVRLTGRPVFPANRRSHPTPARTSTAHARRRALPASKDLETRPVYSRSSYSCHDLVLSTRPISGALFSPWVSDLNRRSMRLDRSR